MSIDDTISANLGLVRSQLYRFKLINDAEATSIAYEALWKACVDFDESHGCQLSTLAMTYIYNALCGYKRWQNRKRQIEEVSYNRVAYCDDNEADREFIDYIASACDTLQDIIMEDNIKEIKEIVEYAREYLFTPRQKEIYDIWMNSDGKLNQSEIAKKLGISQAAVSAAIQRCLYILKYELEGYL